MVALAIGFGRCFGSRREEKRATPTPLRRSLRGRRGSRTANWDRVLMVGLDAAGKTTITERMSQGGRAGQAGAAAVARQPTIGFAVEQVEHAKCAYSLWDVGGQDKLRALWHHFVIGAIAVVFVVDCADRERVATACEELHRLLGEPELPAEAALLVLANKQDVQGAIQADELTKQLKLEPLQRRWHIQETCAVSGEGLSLGFDWLSSNVSEQRSSRGSAAAADDI
ncbi:ADP-ribosylation factor [Emiliania huxleyi CCMP1516]|uniref:ADP-ribosylation factor n=3 Tax=Emiliania huxleyi TaxID=2903 RepID=A0A0D3I4D2_EMIH1|nr:Arf3, ADP-ribosylation factor [Emiliania huxleyi CCMP1516]XP_005780195.1 ADP-ribosylation factor [Emiliania huxleyi CCMP1516]EOD06117.1 Arf3, ADP-ribosylation factor [Emiliania huxleyi CCMP1516]EOD27766.1 ADP-ribosylation factor [Emiliania huxleyi CCMP1516]|eukprot:XP_005758546.1 Arf3, ADP-ribosylation factor [Emiliania huxleyi CCMP1516]